MDKNKSALALQSQEWLQYSIDTLQFALRGLLQVLQTTPKARAAV